MAVQMSLLKVDPWQWSSNQEFCRDAALFNPRARSPVPNIHASVSLSYRARAACSDTRCGEPQRVDRAVFSNLSAYGQDARTCQNRKSSQRGGASCSFRHSGEAIGFL